MSGGPPHHPHGRQGPPTSNTGWNHLQVPNYFPARPQHAHMSNEHSLLQPTWHTPTTEPLKTIPTHSHIFSLEQMLGSERHLSRPTNPGVDLTLTRNGGNQQQQQNGDLPPPTPTAPISLSVRDTNKINSLPASALEIQPIEINLKPLSPVLKPAVSPGITANSDNSSKRRSGKRVDSILERLNPTLDQQQQQQQQQQQRSTSQVEQADPLIINDTDKINTARSVIVQATSQDENSNSSSTTTTIAHAPSSARDDDVVSPYSNEDSLDSNKSRRKRKPSKTVRVTKETETKVESEPEGAPPAPIVIDSAAEPNVAVAAEADLESDSKLLPADEAPAPAKTRRKTSSESETIDNIAAMVNEGLTRKTEEVSAAANANAATTPNSNSSSNSNNNNNKAVSVSVIKTNLQDNTPTSELSSDNVDTTTATATATSTPIIQKKPTNTQLVEVENKLEEMFAGIEDDSSVSKMDMADVPPVRSTVTGAGAKVVEGIKEGASTSQDNVTSTSNDLLVTKKTPKKVKRKQNKNFNLNNKKKVVTNKRLKSSNTSSTTPVKKPKKSAKTEIKDVYAYDSGSNASSSKSKGPFIQIRGPRESPLSVNVINTPLNDDDGDKKTHKNKKFHDDSEYRHKVRSKGLHCSTLSNQYDAQTKDMTWICAFCKRGPHATELTGPSLSGELQPGDLFGPYFIGTISPDFERRFNDPYDRQFKSRKITKALDATKLLLSGATKKKRKSLESQTDDIFLGITDTGNKTYEIWAHEDCIVWSEGTYLVGPKIVGLEEAVWTSCNVGCIICQLKGANICCIKRGCVKIAHVCCARLNDWKFDEVNFKTYCPEHRV